MAGNPTDHCKNSDLDTRQTLPPLPRGVEPGCEVVVRGGSWRVDASILHADCGELHLRSATGAARVLLWPFDRPSAAAEGRRVRVLPLATWARHVGPTLARDLDPRTPRAQFTGEVLAYQLAPAIAMAAGAPRVLLADEVGLGKTVQAGWALADLRSREPDSRVLVAVPAGLRDQWAAELATFFSIVPTHVDAAWLRAAVADRPADVSPWAAPGVYLGSVDFLKRPDVAASLAAVVWDLLIADEAHTAAAPTDRHAVLAAVAAASRRVVLISATPYSGDTAAFESLASLGACRETAAPVLFRRSREDAGDPRRRRHRFVTVRIGHAEFRLQRLVERYTAVVWDAATDATDAARLAMTILRKRALSSPAALLRSVVRRRALLQGTVPAPVQLALFDEAPPDDDLADGALSAPGLTDRAREDRWLSMLVEAAQRVSVGDAKTRFLLRLLRRLAGEPVVVFTEYRDTLRHLAALLPNALQLHGGLSQPERSVVQRRFNDEGGVLIATDAAAEGLNLQRRCRLLVNFELPWNPARLEQRIGRIDRIGQRRRVHAISLVARDTAEDFVVARLARRLARVAATLGERDRLAAFLTDARVARSVIGGSMADAPAETELPVNMNRAGELDYPAARIAAGIARRASPPRTDQIAVARIHVSRFLAPGYVAVARVAARCAGGLVAERVFIVHVEDSQPARPARHTETRARALAIVSRVEQLLPRLELVGTWVAEVIDVHHGVVAARIAREEALGAIELPGPEVQPGLFDRREWGESDTRHAGGIRMREHQERLQLLAASRHVRVECAVTAVLVVWR